MARVLDHIDDATASWIARQPLFFVATAPQDGGHVNVSPKGLDSLRVVSSHEVAYLDMPGSGAETIAHVRDNGRITVMMNAFDGPPRILRIYGEGAVHLPDEPRFAELRGLFPDRRGVRSIITIAVARVQDSCGYAVPKMTFVEHRTHLDRYVENRSDDELAQNLVDKNTVSIDGLPALDR
ncbi:MAG: pyridoxamine 5'-phosphate oxidase family protein [Acidimicrobiia bacterium]